MANDATAGCINFPVLSMLDEAGHDGHRRVPQQRWGEISDDAIRYASPVDVLSRMATQDMEIVGYPLRKGELVLFSLICANHDPTRFGESADAVTLEPGKRIGIPFGIGTHVCVGNKLSRVILKEAYAALARLPAMRTTGRPTYGIGKTIRTITSLPIEFQ